MLTGANANVAGTFAWTNGATVPTVSDNSYEVTFTPTDIQNYNKATTMVTLQVNKATLSALKAVEAITYGQTLSASMRGTARNARGTDVSGSLVWINGDTQKPAVRDSGKTRYEVIFTPTDSTNYESLTTTATLTVRKAEQPVDKITVSSTLLAFGDPAPTFEPIHAKNVKENAKVTYSVRSWDPDLPCAEITNGKIEIYSDGAFRIIATIEETDNYSERKVFSDIIQILPKISFSEIDPVTYNGAAHKPTFTVTLGESILSDDDNDNDYYYYAVTYQDNVNAGTGKAVVTLICFYEEETYTATATFTINPKPATPAIASIAPVTYNGTPQEPALTVTLDNGATPLDNNDYDVAYENNINAGTAQATVTLKGNYAGTATATFIIDKKSVTSEPGDNDGGKVIPPVLPSNPATTVETEVNGKTNKDGTAIAEVKDKAITDSINKAQQEAKKDGTEQNGIAIVVNVKTDAKATSLAFTIPASVIDALIKAGVTQLTIKNSFTSVTLDLATLKALAGGEVQLNINKVAATTLSKEAQTAIGSRPVFRFALTSGGKPITDFKGGRVSLQMPYTLVGNERSGKICGVYVDGVGTVTWMEASSYDQPTNTLLISTTHFSVFGVGYKQNAPTFTDIDAHWAKDDMEFVAARGLLTGTTATAFSPNGSMTRGMFVTALGRLAGVDTKKYNSTKFTDVKADAYYAPYVAWANANSIVNGTTTTIFSPDRAISRQEMAVMLLNYAKAIGYQLPSVHAEIAFTDKASIASWATSAVKEMQLAGILMGKDGGKFDPTATATRAEVSAMLRRYVELVASTDTAEGWV